MPGDQEEPAGSSYGDKAQDPGPSAQEKMMIYTKPIQPKPTKTRSRAGCKYCRDKRKKCSEEKPSCARCVQFGVECIYEPVRPRKKRTTKFTVPSPLGSGAAASSPGEGTSSIPRGVSESSSIPQEHIGFAAGNNAEAPSQSSLAEVWSEATDDDSLSDSIPASSPSISALADGSGSLRENPPRLDLSSLDILPGFSGATTEPISSMVWSPGIGDDFVPWPFLGNMGMSMTDIPDWSEMVAMSAPLPTTSPVNPGTQLSDMTWVNAPPPDAPTPVADFQSPGQRLDDSMLLSHFSITAIELVPGPGNPVADITLPLCYRSNVVRDAACALAGAHLSRVTGAQAEYDYALLHGEALTGLQILAQANDDWAREQSLATLMLLLFYEAMTQRGTQNLIDEHLHHAWQLMCSIPLPDAPMSRLFEQVFRYFDTMNALSTGSSPLSPSRSTLIPNVSALSERGLVSTIGLTDDAHFAVGPAPDLLPTMHRLAELVVLKRQLDQATQTQQAPNAEMLQAEYEAAHHAIEESLLHWVPPLPLGYTLVNRIVDGPLDAPEADVIRARSAAGRALAYKQGGLVILRRLGRHDRGAADGQAVSRHAQASIWHGIASATAANMQGQDGGARTSGTGMLWPLFIAGCEAMETRDRALARQAFSAVENAFRSTVNHGRVWELIIEVWRRRDLAVSKGGPPLELNGLVYRQIAKEVGISLVFG